MFEARVLNAALLKQVIDALKDLVESGTIDCKRTGMFMQAMDSSHVSLCTLQLLEGGFDKYRCDRDVALGLSLTNFAKVLKCAGNDDIITLAAQDDADLLTLIFENKKLHKISDFEFKLMDIDSEQLGIPDTKYDCTVKMSSKEFRTIVSDLAPIGDTCTIAVTKEGVQFSVSGDIGTANVTVKQKSSVEEIVEEKTEKGEKGEKKAPAGEVPCTIEMSEPVKLSFAMRYLLNFTKATPLTDTVRLSMSPEVPLSVEYSMEGVGSVRYYLAPKLDEDGAGGEA